MLLLVSTVSTYSTDGSDVVSILLMVVSSVSTYSTGDGMYGYWQYRCAPFAGQYIMPCIEACNHVGLHISQSTDRIVFLVPYEL